MHTLDTLFDCSLENNIHLILGIGLYHQNNLLLGVLERANERKTTHITKLDRRQTVERLLELRNLYITMQITAIYIQMNSLVLIASYDLVMIQIDSFSHCTCVSGLGK